MDCTHAFKQPLDEEALKPIAPLHSTTDGNRLERSWSTGRVVSLVFLLIAVFAGLVIGTSFAIASAWKDRDSQTIFNQAPSTSAQSPADSKFETQADKLVAASKSLKLLLDNKVTNLSSALVSALAFVETEAIHDAATWEAYVIYRTAVGEAEPLATLYTTPGFQGIQTKIALADRAMLELSDVNVTASILADAILDAQTVATNTVKAPAPSVSGGLSALKDHVEGLVNSQSLKLPARVEETALVDVYGTLLTTNSAIGPLLPYLDATEKPSDAEATAGIRSALTGLMDALHHTHRSAADFWLTKMPKAENCEEEVAKSLTECSGKLAELKAGVGCTPSNCAEKLAQQQAKCDVERVEKAVKCVERYAFLKVCAQDYQNTLLACTGNVTNAEKECPSQSSECFKQISKVQWTCRDAADQARNRCIQVSEVTRKCREDRLKVINACTGPSGSCDVKADAQQAACLTQEMGKRVQCKFSKRTEHIKKCSLLDEDAMRLCSAVSSQPARYEQCLADANADAVACKFNIEREVKKCEDELPCKTAKEAGEAQCDKAYTTANANCNTAAVNATACEAAASNTRAECVQEVKAVENTCKTSAAADTQKWVSEQESKKEISQTITRYQDFLPYSLLTTPQRSRLEASLTTLASSLQAMGTAWSNFAAAA